MVCRVLTYCAVLSHVAIVTWVFCCYPWHNLFFLFLLRFFMQVKGDFGHIGRTKYTHLTDQDTTQVCRLVPSSNGDESKTRFCFSLMTTPPPLHLTHHHTSHPPSRWLSQKDSAWSQKTHVSEKMQTKMAGMKQVFDRPSAKRKRP